MPYRGIKKQERFMKLCQQLDGFETGKHQVVIPDIDKSHYSVIDIIIDNDSANYITKVFHYDSLVHPKTRSLTMQHVPAQVKDFIQNFVRVFNKFVLNLKNHSCDASKVLLNVVQVTCPIQQNGIDCGLFAIAICLHIFEGTEIGPHIFTQEDITKLRKYLPSLLSKDRNERYVGIQSMFPYLPSPSPSQMAPQGVLPRSPLGGVELPQTIKLIAGGCFQGNICFEATHY